MNIFITIDNFTTKYYASKDECVRQFQEYIRQIIIDWAEKYRCKSSLYIIV